MSDELENKKKLEGDSFCPIHNKIEDNKNHSKNIKVCERCQEVLLKQLER